MIIWSTKTKCKNLIALTEFGFMTCVLWQFADTKILCWVVQTTSFPKGHVLWSNKRSHEKIIIIYNLLSYFYPREASGPNNKSKTFESAIKLNNKLNKPQLIEAFNLTLCNSWLSLENIKIKTLCKACITVNVIERFS